MQINPLIFRSYDIRGIVGKDLNEEKAKLIGKGFATYLKKKFNGDKIAVGKDGRLSSPSLGKAFIEGLIECGAKVIDLGEIPTPMLYFGSCVLGVDGAAQITASHNPKEYNGVKFVAKNAHSICDQALQEILEIIESGNFLQGHGEILKEQNIFPAYLKKILSMVKIKRKLKVVVDAGNGIASNFVKPFFSALNCEVIPLFCELDGNFPNHEANPEEIENLKDLIVEVKKNQADLGIAFDGDADRVGIIDEQGRHYHADQLLVLLAESLLKKHPQAKIVFDIKSSMVLEEAIKKNNGIPIVSKTGHSHIETKIRGEKALLGGEVSGHMFFADDYYGFDDAFLAAAKLLEILGQQEEPFSALLKDLPKLSNTPEIKAGCPDEIKFQIVEKLKDYFSNKYRCVTIDGVKMYFDEQSWGIVRCSNTSPNLTLRFEAPNEIRLKEIIKIVADKLQEYPEINLDWYKTYQN